MKSIARFVTAVVLAVAILVPPWYVNPGLLVLADTPLGTFSLHRASVLVGVLTILIMQIAQRKLPRPVWSDLVTCVLLVLTLSRADSVTSKAAFWILMVITPYFLGRMLWSILDIDLLALLVRVGRIAGLVEAVLSIVTVFTGPIWEAAYHSSIADQSVFGEKMIPGIEGVFRSTGTLGHPIPLGAVLVFSLACWLFSPNLKSYWRLSGILTILIALISTFSRGGWLAAVLVLGGWLLVGKQRLRRVAVLFTAGLVTLGVLWAVSPNTLDTVVPRLLMTNSSDNSVSHRLLMIDWSATLWLRSPSSFLIGYGPGATGELLIKYPPLDWFPVIDNQFLAVAVEFGLLGLFVLFIWGLLIPAAVIHNRFLFRDERARPYIGLAFGVLALSLDGTFFEFLAQEPIAVLFSISVGCLASGIGTFRSSVEDTNNGRGVVNRTSTAGLREVGHRPHKALQR